MELRERERLIDSEILTRPVHHGEGVRGWIDIKCFVEKD